MRIEDELRIALDGKWGHIRELARKEMVDQGLGLEPGLGIEEARDRTMEQLRLLVDSGIPATGFGVEAGGTGDPGASVTGIEMVAQFDLSLMVKAGVQWGLFGGAVENLGTAKHHEKYVRDLINLDLLGCYAMSETGHGSNVQHLETTATYDVESEEFVVHSPTPSARKDYIGGAARDARMAAVFAQLWTGGVTYGVHCFLVPIRDEAGHDLPGVTTADDGYKGGLIGVDNGRLVFEQVRIPRDNLLDRIGQVAPDGSYSSDIENENARFFTMLGTLIRGRISVGGSARSAAEVALTIAVRYAEQRRQFGPDDEEVVIMDYLVHQRRLLPLIARTYAFRFAQNQLVARMDRLQSATDVDPRDQRELESRAAGLKALQTWHASRTIQECREACGGAGYLAENRLSVLRGDIDVFTTFEGDNHVLLQLVAKGLLTDYSSAFEDLDQLGMVRFVAELAVETVVERTAVHQLLERIKDVLPGGDDGWDQESGLLDSDYQLAMLRWREEHMLAGVARRLKRGIDAKMDPVQVFSQSQDHVIGCARAHVERLVLEAFVAKARSVPEGDNKVAVNLLCDLHALSVIEGDRGWFLEHGRLSSQRSKAISREITSLCRKIRPLAKDLVDAFGVPEELLRAELLTPLETS